MSTGPEAVSIVLPWGAVGDFCARPRFERTANVVLQDVARRLKTASLLPQGSSGNLSIMSLDTMMTTAKGQRLADTHLVRAVGLKVPFDSPPRNITTEWMIHLAVYMADPSARVVIHTHAFHSTVAACRGYNRLPELHYYQAELGSQGTPVVGFLMPGSIELAEAVYANIDTHDVAMLLRNHGSLVWGSTVHEAVERCIILEQVCAYVNAVAPPLPAALPEGALLSLRDMFAEYKKSR